MIRAALPTKRHGGLADQTRGHGLDVRQVVLLLRIPRRRRLGDKALKSAVDLPVYAFVYAEWAVDEQSQQQHDGSDCGQETGDHLSPSLPSRARPRPLPVPAREVI